MGAGREGRDRADKGSGGGARSARLAREAQDFVAASLADPFVPAPPRVDRSRLVDCVVRELEAGRPVSLCAPSGSGATSLLSAVAVAWRAKGRDVRSVSLAGLDSGQTPQALAWARQVLARDPRCGRETLLLVDDVARTEEFDAEDAARTVSLIVRDRPVVCALGPRADLLVERLGVHFSLDAEGLAVRYDEARQWAPGQPARSGREFMDRTAGIAALAEADWTDAQAAGASCRYEEERSRLVEDAIQSAPMREERRLRAACALLGTGSMEDVRALEVRALPDMVESTRREARVLGLVQNGVRFSLAGGPRCPEGAARLVAREFPELVVNAVAHLCGHGQVPRAVQVATAVLGVIECGELFWSVLAEVWDAGGAAVLQQLRDRCADGSEQALRCDALLGTSGYEEASRSAWRLRADPDPVRAVQGRQMAAWAALRHQPAHLLGKPPHLPYPEASSLRCRSASERTAYALEAHVELREMQGAGELAEARALAGRFRGVTEPGSLTDALLRLDRCVGALSVGEPLTERDREEAAAAVALLRRCGDERTALYEEATWVLAQVAAGDPVRRGTLDEALASAVRLGDGLARGTVLCAQALEALCDGQLVTARADAAEARRAAETGASPTLVAAAALVAATADLLSGKRPEPPPSCGPAAFRTLGDALVFAATPGGERPEVRVSVAPALVLTLLEQALQRPGPVADRLWRVLPGLWREAFRRRLGRHGGPRRRARQLSLLPAGAEGTAPRLDLAQGPQLAIGLLGGLSFRLDGELMDPRTFRRTAARNLLALLAARNGHQASRVELVTHLWPGMGRRRANNNLSSAMSCVRTALQDREYGRQRLLSTRDLVSLNPDCVVCDVDAFEASVSRVLACDTSDAERVRLCQALANSYCGGTYVPVDAPGAEEMSLFHDWLQRRYVEALVAGSSAASRLGHKPEALGIAREAARWEPDSEDALQRLMETLGDAGRPQEGMDYYDSYLRRRRKAGLRRPAGALQEAYERLLAAAQPAVA